MFHADPRRVVVVRFDGRVGERVRERRGGRLKGVSSRWGIHVDDGSFDVSDTKEATLGLHVMDGFDVQQLNPQRGMR